MSAISGRIPPQAPINPAPCKKMRVDSGPNWAKRMLFCSEIIKVLSAYYQNPSLKKDIDFHLKVFQCVDMSKASCNERIEQLSKSLLGHLCNPFVNMRSEELETALFSVASKDPFPVFRLFSEQGNPNMRMALANFLSDQVRFMQILKGAIQQDSSEFFIWLALYQHRLNEEAGYLRKNRLFTFQNCMEDPGVQEVIQKQSSQKMDAWMGEYRKSIYSTPFRNLGADVSHVCMEFLDRTSLSVLSGVSKSSHYVVVQHFTKFWFPKHFSCSLDQLKSRVFWFDSITNKALKGWLKYLEAFNKVPSPFTLKFIFSIQKFWAGWCSFELYMDQMAKEAVNQTHFNCPKFHNQIWDLWSKVFRYTSPDLRSLMCKLFVVWMSETPSLKEVERRFQQFPEFFSIALNDRRENLRFRHDIVGTFLQLSAPLKGKICATKYLGKYPYEWHLKGIVDDRLFEWTLSKEGQECFIGHKSIVHALALFSKVDQILYMLRHKEDRVRRLVFFPDAHGRNFLQSLVFGKDGSHAVFSGTQKCLEKLPQDILEQLFKMKDQKKRNIFQQIKELHCALASCYQYRARRTIVEAIEKKTDLFIYLLVEHKDHPSALSMGITDIASSKYQWNYNFEPAVIFRQKLCDKQGGKVFHKKLKENKEAREEIQRVIQTLIESEKIECLEKIAKTRYGEGLKMIAQWRGEGGEHIGQFAKEKNLSQVTNWLKHFSNKALSNLAK